MIEHEIPAGVRPMAAEKYIRRAWPMLPGRAVRQLFERRDVKRGGARLGAGDAVAGGDVLRLYLPDALTDFSIETVFDDGRLLAAVKPQGLPVDADQDGVGADTLRTRLTRIHPTARLCHRLDAATGGLVLAAMDDETEAQALQSFRDHALQKTYYALAKGGFDRPEGVLRAYLIKDAAKSLVRVVHSPRAGAKPIETRYRVADERGGIARVELEPITGRTHQLRAHMEDFGHPLLGDDKYGDRELNRRAPGPLRLWCGKLALNRDCPLADYRGQTFAALPPEWWELK